MKLAEKYVFSSSTVANIDRDAINQNESGYGFHLMEKAAKFSFEILKNFCAFLMILNEKSSCVRYPSGRLKAGGAPKPPSDYISTKIPPSRF